MNKERTPCSFDKGLHQVLQEGGGTVTIRKEIKRQEKLHSDMADKAATTKKLGMIENITS